MSSRGGSGGRGRGEYYKNKYGRGGRGRDSGGGRGRDSGGGRGRDSSGGRGRDSGGGRGRDSRGGDNYYGSGRSQRQQYQNKGDYGYNNHNKRGGGSYDDLMQLLERIDGRQYPSYHDLETPPNSGWKNHDVGFIVEIGKAQSDPFAKPTQARVTVSTANLPKTLISNPIRRMATADYLLRKLYDQCKQMGADNSLRDGNDGGAGGDSSGGRGGWHGPKGGDVQVMKPTQNVVEQTAVQVDATGNVICQITINLPARGRTVLGLAASRIFGQILTQLVKQSLKASALDVVDMTNHVDSVEDQLWLQDQLDKANLISFVRNGAILPRISGVDDRPMRTDNAVPFQSPSSLEQSFTLPNAGVKITGMGIPKGITLICGGGFHGKSTLLQALQLAVYPKIPSDGREFCVTNPKAAKIRAEDGRSVTAVDISNFIKNLPFGKDTTCFTTEDASGSTSQASNIIEAIELGCDTLLIDEDTCATNFMIRDNKMMQLVACEREPITPFVRVVESIKKQGISTVMVVGGTGDFFDVADYVLVMDSYRCEDATAKAKQIVESNEKNTALHASFSPARERVLVPDKYFADSKFKVLARNVISYGDTEIDLSSVEQIVSGDQASAISFAVRKLLKGNSKQKLRAALEELELSLKNDGMAALESGLFNGALIRPRLLEIGAALNRLRKQCIEQS